MSLWRKRFYSIGSIELVWILNDRYNIFKDHITLQDCKPLECDETHASSLSLLPSWLSFPTSFHYLSWTQTRSTMVWILSSTTSNDGVTRMESSVWKGHVLGPNQEFVQDCVCVSYVWFENVPFNWFRILTWRVKNTHSSSFTLSTDFYCVEEYAQPLIHPYNSSCNRAFDFFPSSSLSLLSDFFRNTKTGSYVLR